MFIFNIIDSDKVRKKYKELESHSEKLEYLLKWKKICETRTYNLQYYTPPLFFYSKYEKLVEWIDLEIKEIQSFQSLQNNNSNDSIKPTEIKSPIISETDSKIEKIVWNLSQDNLIEFSEDLIKFGYIKKIEKYQIFDHFVIKDKIHKNYQTSTNNFSKIIWLKSTSYFTTFINKLIEKNVITVQYKKYKIFCYHFLNKNNEEFDLKLLAKYTNQNKNHKTNPHEELVDLINQLK